MVRSSTSSPSLEALEIREPNTHPKRCSDLPTPPGTDDGRMILDSAVSKAISVFKSRENNSTNCPNLRLTHREYGKFRQELEQNPSLQYARDKVLYDYDPDVGVLKIRMLTPLHEIVSACLVDDITQQLRHVAKCAGPVGNFAARIVNWGSSDIPLDEILKDGVLLERQPDIQFGLDDAAYPGVIIEVSYSQDRRDLDKLAWQYIQGSNGKIKVVIGIDINYHDKSSSVSLWRPNIFREEGDTTDTLDVRQEIKAEQFRSSDGLCENSTKTLELSLNDFASNDVGVASDSVMLSIPYSRLADFVNRAERSQRAREQERTNLRASKQRTNLDATVLKKRRRPSSSADEIDSEDEARCRAAEDKAMAKVSDADEYFQPGGT